MTQESDVAGLPPLLLASDMATKLRYKRHKKLVHVTQESDVAGLPNAALPAFQQGRSDKPQFCTRLDEDLCPMMRMLIIILMMMMVWIIILNQYY